MKAGKLLFFAIALFFTRCEFNNDTSRDFSTLPNIEIKNENNNIIDNPGTIEFGEIESGFSVKKTIEINNLGNQKLFISDLETDNENFTLNKTSTSLSVKGFETTTLEIIYRPITADTNIKARLTIASNSRNNDVFIINLAGERIISDDLILLIGKEGDYTGQVKNNGTLDLGTISLSDCTETSLTIMNALLTGLQISSIELDDEPPFSMINTAKYNLCGGEKTSFTLIFKPDIETGEFSRELYIKSSSETMPVFSITVKGTIITNSVPTINIKKDYNLINEFSNYLFDTTPLNSSTQMVFEIQNTGTEELEISEFLIDNEDDFRVDTSNTQLNLKQNETTSFRVIFSPASLEGKKKVKISISSNDLNNPVFNFYCSGYPCEEEYSHICIYDKNSDSIDNNSNSTLNNTTVLNSNTKTYFIKNTGTIDLQIFSIIVDNTDYFKINTNSMNNVIEPGESSTFTLTFEPDEVKTYTTELKITSNSKENSSFCINIVAQALASDNPNLEVYHENSIIEHNSNYFFTATTINNGSSYNIVLKNTGKENLIIKSAAITSLTSNIFSLSKTITNYTLSNNEAISLSIYFIPKAEKSYSGYITISTNDPTNSTFTINLNGEGVVLPTFSVYQNNTIISNNSNIERGNYVKSVNKNVSIITIKNTGSTTLQINEISFIGNGKFLPEIITIGMVYSSDSTDYFVLPGQETCFEVWTPYTDQCDFLCNIIIDIENCQNFYLYYERSAKEEDEGDGA